MSARELYDLYDVFGNKPWLYDESGGCKFNDWKYAEESCESLASTVSDRKSMQTRVDSILARIDSPILALVLNDKSKTADDVYSDIYIINVTDDEFAKSQADFFQTVDENTGQGVTTGPKSTDSVILPRSYLKVGDIIEWELDSALGFIVTFKSKSMEKFKNIAYDLKSGARIKCQLPVMNVTGVICRGLEFSVQ